MRELYLAAKYKKDLRRIKKRGKDIRKLERIVAQLVSSQPLHRRHKVHRLTGNLSALWECHIESDWLLLWTEDALSIYLARTGTHSDVFE